jgi:hypothetical protein
VYTTLNLWAILANLVSSRNIIILERVGEEGAPIAKHRGFLTLAPKTGCFCRMMIHPIGLWGSSIHAAKNPSHLL